MEGHRRPALPPGQVKKIVYVRARRPQFTKSNLLSECLGRVMVEELLLSEADCEEIPEEDEGVEPAARARC